MSAKLARASRAPLLVQLLLRITPFLLPRGPLRWLKLLGNHALFSKSGQRFGDPLRSRLGGNSYYMS
eukprot:2725311-Pyramimonas_sp.AAC.1